MGAHPIPDAALESDIAILGKKGRGKSYTARGLVERLLDAGRQVVVLDPLSTWWGLKAGPHGYPIPVIGGPHADLPLVDTAGEALGRFLATSDQSVVIDLGALRKAELVRFATSFFEALYVGNRKPIWLVLEEADVFAPQQPMPETARMLGEVDRIARRGRQFGFKLISLTQRPARLNKDVLTQLSTLVALGLTSPQDRDAIKAWVEGAGDRDKAKAVLDSLASLKVGEGWVWSPDHQILERVRFPKIKTPDTSATPKAGEPRKVAKVRGDVDVAALRAALAPGPAAASAGLTRRASEPNAAPTAPASEAELAAAEQRGYDRGYEAAAKTTATEARTFIAELRAKCDHFEQRLDSGWFYRDEGSTDGHFPDPKSPAPSPTVSGKAAATTAKPAAKYSSEYSSPRKVNGGAPVSKPESVGVLTGPQRQLLKALAWWKAMGHPAPSRAQVAAIAGWKITSGHLKNVAGSLSSAGLITYPRPGAFAFTDAGAAAAPEPDLQATLVESLSSTLTGPQRTAVDALLVKGGRRLSRSDLARDCGWEPTSGHVKNVIGSLSTLEIVQYPEPGVVELQDWVR